MYHVDMKIVSALPKHIPQINELLSQNYLLKITTDHLKKDSIALVLIDQEKVMGFVWAGYLSNRTEAYVDNFILDTSLHGSKVSVFLLVELANRLLNAGVKRAFSVVEEQNKFGFASAVRQFQLGGIMAPSTYKLFNFYPEGVQSKLGNEEGSNERQ